MKRKSVLPEEFVDVQPLVLAECHMTPTELDEMPQRMLERLLLYKEVQHVAIWGGELR